jgi:hypothetical protein
MVGIYPMLYCDICELYAKNESLFLDSIAEKKRYLLHSEIPDPQYVDQMRRFVRTAVLPYIITGKALDYGAGRTGTLQKMLENAGFTVSTYDTYFYPNQSIFNDEYDVVTATEVVEHFQDLDSEWIKLLKLVKKGGILAISTMFVKNDISDWWYLRDITHYHFYGERTFEGLAMKHRLEILYTDHQAIIVFKKF